MTEASGDFEARRQIVRLQMLYEVGLALADSLDPHVVADEILQRAIAMVDARAGLLLLPDDEDQPRLVAQAGVDDAEALAASDDVLGGWGTTEPSQISARAGHLCRVPLRSHGETRGLLVVLDKESRGAEPGPFPSEDEDLLDALGLQAGAALRNARLHVDLQTAFGELQAAQEKIARLEQVRALGDMAAELAHAMRHVLGLVIGHADSHITLNTDASAAVRSILTAAEAGQGVLDRIGQVTRLGVRRERAVEDLNDIAHAALEQAKALPTGTGVTWQADLASALPPVSINAADVQEALLNLLENAARAAAGGTVTLRSRLLDDEVIELCVEDDGPGFPPEVGERLTEPFYSTRGEAGAGLGLSIVFRIAEDHGGELRYDSTPGEGATFCVRLPVNRPVADEPSMQVEWDGEERPDR